MTSDRKYPSSSYKGYTRAYGHKQKTQTSAAGIIQLLLSGHYVQYIVEFVLCVRFCSGVIYELGEAQQDTLVNSDKKEWFAASRKKFRKGISFLLLEGL